ncbi:MAG TPA: ADP-ribosylglycohydrolase family protein [Flavobacteriales bacterium]|nr:ADP-ribosylglycohydrolase family protein [Flavobacteriales bacterium]
MRESDKCKGALLGLAIGDALGTTLEFKRPGTFEPLTDMVGGGPFALEVGKWTDDTSMALCLADSLIERKEFDAFDQLDKYNRWYRLGFNSSVEKKCVDIGNATRQALDLYDMSGQPYCGDPDPQNAGNGSIMRLAPIAIFYRNNFNALMKYAVLSSKTTHAAPQCFDGCKYMAAILMHLFKGEPKEKILDADLYETCFPDGPAHPSIGEVISESYKRKNPPAIEGTGYVVRTLEAALWAFYHTDNFEEGALKVVNLGRDADTTGAVYGQIAGAYYGMSGIPQKWLDKLYWKNEIEARAEKLFNLSS